jgi:hypothetical protein
MGVNWNDPHSFVSKYFRVIETLYLPQWHCTHIPSEQEKSNIIICAKKLDTIREFLNLPIKIHCFIRPILNNPASIYNGQDYNALVHGAKESAHKVGLAADWDAGEDCDTTRAKLLPMLGIWNIRMEHLPVGSPWVHIDNKPPINGNRYFVP